MSDPRPVLALVGGFLGAGKTTLVMRAAELLAERGVRAAIIANDQGGALVDSRYAAGAGIPTGEVRGGCFCCRFSDLVGAAQELLAYDPGVIFAEAVGSCIDVAATTLRPLAAWHGGRFRLAPFTVLVDPARARQMLAEDADPALSYLFRNQLAEADLVCLTKADLEPGGDHSAMEGALRVSARTGEGVAEWLARIFDDAGVGGKLLDVDYSVYAAAEAALGWLNWQARVELRRALAPAMVLGPLIDALDEELTRSGALIAHLKVLDETRTGAVKAAICENGAEPVVEGALFASPSRRHELLVNLRAKAAPEVLESALELSVGRLPGRITVIGKECFRPAPPQPAHRMERVGGGVERS